MKQASKIALNAGRQHQQAEIAPELGKVRQDGYWNNADCEAATGSTAEAAPTRAGAKPGSTLAPAPAKNISRFASLAAAASPVLLAVPAAAANAAPSASGWLGSLWSYVAAYIPAGAVFGGIHLVQKSIKWGINALAKNKIIGENAKDALHFYVTSGAWAAALSLGLYKLGILSETLLTTFVLGATQAAKKKFGNYTQTLLFVKNRPFKLNEIIGLEGNLQIANDMTMDKMNFEVIGRLAVKPTPEEEQEGRVMALKNVIAGRVVDVKGNRFVIKPGSNERKESWYTYTQLNENPITIFRPYETNPAASHSFLSNDIQPQKIGFLDIIKTAAQRPKIPLLKALAATGVAIATPFLLPELKDSMGAALRNFFPYLQAASTLSIALAGSYYIQNWALDLITELAKKFNRARAWAIVAKFLTRIALYAGSGYFLYQTMGISMAALPASFNTLYNTIWAKLGAGFAFSYITSDVWMNWMERILYRRDFPYKIGERIEEAKEIGTLKKIGIQYLTLADTENSHILVPNPIGTFHSFGWVGNSSKKRSEEKTP